MQKTPTFSKPKRSTTHSYVFLGCSWYLTYRKVQITLLGYESIPVFGFNVSTMLSRKVLEQYHMFDENAAFNSEYSI
jgi:hypothetical protein